MNFLAIVQSFKYAARNRHSGMEVPCMDVRPEQCPGGKFLGIVSQDPSDSKCNRLHVDIFRFSFHSFELYSIGSSKTIGKFPEVSNSTGSSATTSGHRSRGKTTKMSRLSTGLLLQPKTSFPCVFVFRRHLSHWCVCGRCRMPFTWTWVVSKKITWGHYHRG